MKKTTLKDVITSGEWIITKVHQGYNGRVRIDAKRRHHKADEPDFFSEWGTLKYINRLRAEADKKPLEITHY